MEENYKLRFGKSVVNSLPTLFFGFLWIGIFASGVQLFKDVLPGASAGLGVLVWAVVMLNLTRIIPSPQIWYDEVKRKSRGKKSGK